MVTPYSLNEDWEIGVEPQPDGAVQLQVRETDRKRQEEANRDERGRRMCYWGYRFEQLCTSSRGIAGGGTAGGSANGAGAVAGKPAGGAYRVPTPSDPESYSHLYAAPELAELRRRYGAPEAPGVARGAPAGGVNAN